MGGVGGGWSLDEKYRRPSRPVSRCSMTWVPPCWQWSALKRPDACRDRDRRRWHSADIGIIGRVRMDRTLHHDDDRNHPRGGGGGGGGGGGKDRPVDKERANVGLREFSSCRLFRRRLFGGDGAPTAIFCVLRRSLCRPAEKARLSRSRSARGRPWQSSVCAARQYCRSPATTMARRICRDRRAKHAQCRDKNGIIETRLGHSRPDNNMPGPTAFRQGWEMSDARSATPVCSSTCGSGQRSVPPVFGSVGCAVGEGSKLDLGVALRADQTRRRLRSSRTRSAS